MALSNTNLFKNYTLQLVLGLLIDIQHSYVADYQFPIDVSGVAKDHPFLETDSLQSLFRRLHALNRCAKMKLDHDRQHHHHQNHHITNNGKTVSMIFLVSYQVQEH